MSLDPADVWRRIDDARAADNEASALVERHQRQLDEARSARDAAAGQLAAIPSYRVMERRRAAAELEANEADLAEREAASRAAQEAYQERHSAFCRLRVELLHQLPPECDAEWWTDLQQQLATAVADRERIEARQGELEEELRRLQVEIDEVRAEPPTPLDYQLVEDLAPQVPGLRDRRDELSEQFALLESQRRDLEAQRSEIVDAIDATADVLIGDAVVVAMPISALPTSRAVLGRRFDTVIIDEAGDIELPLLVLAASLASSGVALIGDLVSPGPVIDPRPGLHSLSTERLSPPARHWLTTEPFHHLGLRQPGDVDNERGCVAITRQYRCGKAIESLVNRMVYDHRLWSGPRWRNPVDDGHGELVLVDTSGLASPWALSDQRPGHWPLGVLLAARLVELHHGLTIGLVSPNREQAALLRAMAVDTGRGEQLVAGTVDDLRGHHVDVVVLDLVSGPWGGDGLAAAPAEGDAPAAELRAAAAALTASNGRVYLIVGPEAGDPAAGDPTAGDPTAGDPTAGDPTAGDPAAGLRPLLRELGDRDLTTIEAMSLLDDEQLTGGGPALGLSPSRIGSVVRATPKERFYLRLDELIGQCRQRLDIWSPHYSERRIKTLGRRWGPLAHSGRVNARLLPPRTDQEHQALALLRRTGVIAHHSEDLNERLVIVDGRRVLWGSLDVLSSNRRTATMYELDSPTLARLLRARADGYSG